MSDLQTNANEEIEIYEEAAGTTYESMLITTDSFEEFSQELSASLDEDGSPINKVKSIINEIQGNDSSATITNNPKVSSSNISALSEFGSQDLLDQNDDSVLSGDYLHDPDWLSQREHFFVLSSAGKPIYSLHGNEDKLATLYGVMQALVSVVQANQDVIMSIHAVGIKFVFLLKGPLILVAASRRDLSVQQIQLQLTDVYNQILSTLTLSHMTKIFDQRKNFDLRRLLAGSERLIDHLLTNDSQKRACNKISNNPFIFLTHSVRILPLASAVRESIITAIQQNCSKIKNLVFAVLIANNKLIALVRMKKYFIHPADLRLIFNLVDCSESFKSAESWTPICLPKFDADGFLHAHVSYLADDCQACLLLLSVEKDVFFTLSDAKQKITERLRRSNVLKLINDAMNSKGINLRTIGIPEIRHFLYKSKTNAQLLCSEINVPYNTPEEFSRLESLYYDIHHRIHNSNRPTKLIYQLHEKEIILAWITNGYELYAVFEPTVDKSVVITLVNKLLGWIKKEEEMLFILNAPTF
ncbi:vacuolar fusion protein MON1 homolog A [Contarinia nasturtii]|uniref:vacuolar fusion protein MON1 homolog A n=1 Tax=Contarinia nasturtii TaxID=265458 RepID=UPI0012D3821E|nr:vacuolar fusion protein MON1 homolog A [Contarinia nasturtii]